MLTSSRHIAAASESKGGKLWQKEAELAWETNGDKKNWLHCHGTGSSHM